MNRSIALFVALVALLAHTLAIYDLGDGRLAFPFDDAYVPMRVARNWVHEGQAAWLLGSPAFESHPSALWVLVCALGETLSPVWQGSMNRFVQSVGILCALASVVVSSLVLPKRSAGLIASGCLATSGVLASAAASGTEMALLALLVTLAFVALERGSGWLFALSASLAVLTRPSALVFVLGLLAVRAIGRPTSRSESALRDMRHVKPGWCALPLVVFGGGCVARWILTGHVLSSDISSLFSPRDGQWRDGLLALRDFVTSSISPLLLAFPATMLLRGRLSHAGAHAGFLALCWLGYLVLSGRDPGAFSLAVVPALPLFFLAVQEGVIAAMDLGTVLVRRVTAALLVMGLAGSVLASRLPGDLGPLPLRTLHEAWVAPTQSARHGYQSALARMGLFEELTITARMRKLGLFAREELDPSATLLTAWPGACGYLGRGHVLDLLGRATQLDGPADAPRAWTRRERVDVVAALALGPDYVVPSCAAALESLKREQLAADWLVGFDERSGEVDRKALIAAGFNDYELVTIPLSDPDAPRALPDSPSGPEPFHLLRHRRLGQGARLDVRVEGAQDSERVRVLLTHRGHPQIVDLMLWFVDEQGRVLNVRPTGETSEDPRVRARTRLLLSDSGVRAVELFRGELPSPRAGTRWSEVRARLLNPGFESQDDFAHASEVASARVP